MGNRGLRIMTYTAMAVLSAALIGACAWGVGQKKEAESYRHAAEGMYQRAYSELLDGLSEMEVTLEKLLITNSKKQTVLMLNDVSKLSGSCSSLMGQVPSAHPDSADMNSFIIRVGDYAASLTNRILGGGAISDEDHSQLEKLLASCSRIASELEQSINDGTVSVALMSTDGYYTASGADEAVSANADMNGEEGDTTGETEEFPTLIYDGPFSEAAEKAEPKGLSGEEMSEEQALEKAKEYVEKCIGTGISLEFAGASEGRIASYDFYGTTEDGKSVDLSVTKVGGMLHWLRTGSAGDEEGKPDDEGMIDEYKNAAHEMLKALGFEGMEATYAQYYAGSVLINFAATCKTEGGESVILYSDLIKVWVDRETKKAVGFDARNYIFSHTERSLAAEMISIDEARGSVSPLLTVESERLALVPETPERETLCYEFKCTLGEQYYIIYIDVVTGDEVKIFKIIDSSDGELTV